MVTLLALAGVAASLFPLAGEAVTEGEVEEACADSRAQLEEYRAAQTAFREAAEAYEASMAEVDKVARKQQAVAGSVDSYSVELEEIEAQIQQQAVELYMQGGFSNPGLIFSASSVDQVLTSYEFLTTATSGSRQSIEGLLAARNELNRFQGVLDETRTELEEVEAQLLVAQEAQQETMEAEQAAYAKLSSRCQELSAQYEAELAAAREAAKQRASGSVQVGPFICPFTPGRTSFIDSWGFPRSGGRTHKGTDLFAPWNEPVYAVASGRVALGNGGLGGQTIWLTADNGVAYYYAHLAGFNVSSGSRVSQGATIGFNGNSGNASGGAPHVHLQIHPGGRGSAPVNPYATLVAACR